MTNYDEQIALSLRLSTYEVFIHNAIAECRPTEALGHVRALLHTLPRLKVVNVRTIRCLMGGQFS